MVVSKRSKSWKPTKSQIKKYQTLAARADKRLQRMEALATTPYYSIGVTSDSFAYAKVQKKISDKYGTNRTGRYRFGQVAPATRGELAEKIKDIEWFLKLKTSTKTGITEMYKKQANTLNKKYKTDFTWQQWATLWGSNAKSAGGDDAILGSDSFVRAIAQVKQNADEMKMRVFDANNIHLYKNISPEFMKTNLNAMLNDSRIPWDKIFLS